MNALTIHSRHCYIALQKKQKAIQPGTKATKQSIKDDHHLMMKWCASKAVAPAAPQDHYFQAYVRHISSGLHSEPSRYHLMQSLDQLDESVLSVLQSKMLRSSFLALQMDAWTSNGRHLTALCVTTPGFYAFANAYENW
jgi:hypothetical protein